MSFNILIVDDSQAMRAVVRKIIAMSGFRVDKCLEAGNGREALDRMDNEWVDVIISDINMPGVNGLEMLKELKKDELYARIPVIMISTEGSEERIQEALGSGARGFIKKPFLPEELRKILYDVLGVGDNGTYAEDRAELKGCDF